MQLDEDEEPTTPFSYASTPPPSPPERLNEGYKPKPSSSSRSIEVALPLVVPCFATRDSTKRSLIGWAATQLVGDKNTISQLAHSEVLWLQQLFDAVAAGLACQVAAPPPQEHPQRHLEALFHLCQRILLELVQLRYLPLKRLVCINTLALFVWLCCSLANTEVHTFRRIIKWWLLSLCYLLFALFPISAAMQVFSNNIWHSLCMCACVLVCVRERNVSVEASLRERERRRADVIVFVCLLLSNLPAHTKLNSISILTEMSSFP